MSNGMVRYWGIRMGPPLAVGMGIVLLALGAGGGYQLSLLTIMCANIIVLVGLNIIAGYGGQMALGQAGFMGIGAYATVISISDWRLPSWAALAVAPAIGAVVGLIIGIPTLRLKGIYFAVATVALGVVVHNILLQGGTLTGGPDGRGGLKPLQIGSLMFDTGLEMFVLCLVLAVLALTFSQWMVRTWAGWGLRGANVSEHAATSVGVPIFSARLVAFVIAGALGALGGTLVAFSQLYVSPSLALRCLSPSICLRCSSSEVWARSSAPS